MKLCILSDSHDNRELLAAAVWDAKVRGAVAALHCGDVVAANTLSVFKKLKFGVKSCIKKAEIRGQVLH